MLASWSLSATSSSVSEFFIWFAWRWNKGIPGATALARHTGKTGPRRRVGDVDEVIAGWALNLSPSKLHLTLQMLLAMWAFKFEIVRGHGCAKCSRRVYEHGCGMSSVECDPQTPRVHLDTA